MASFNVRAKLHVLSINEKTSQGEKPKPYKTVTVVNRETYDKEEFFLAPNIEVKEVDKNRLYEVTFEIKKEGFKTNVSVTSLS